MKSLFNYENKLMQLLMTMGDMILLNVVFLLCCIPIITIGAAQAGLCAGLRQLTNKDDDRSCVAAFFKGFANGFGKITAAFCIMLVLIVLVGYTAASVLFFDVNGFSGAPVVLSVVALCICAVFQTLISVFHSQFSCTVWQLFRNSWLLFLAHPLRCITAGVLAWLPLVLLLVDLGMFILITPIVLTLCYSFLFLLINTLMKKPFNDLIQMFYEKNTPAPETAEITE